ncbi:MAG: hypothetical protein BWX86_02647 [Verrucomicrobia bacterium ADurb.Bin122]|nr:MAG: hypothetical protein BWX86_02647 [Verrucomicrobia bacterium ADurb.Bin122]
MILALRNGLAEHLAARHFPVMVAFGDERPAPRGAPRQAHRVLLERDAAGDEIRAPVGCSSNPRRVYARFVGYVATVYAAAPKPGALAVEHAIECDRIVDGVLVALHDWAKANGAIVEIVAGRMLAPDEMQGAEVAIGAAYELRFRLGRSVDRTQYDGTAEPTTTVGVVNTTAAATLGALRDEV